MVKTSLLILLTLIPPIWLAIYIAHFTIYSPHFDQLSEDVRLEAHYLRGTLTWNDFWMQMAAEHRPIVPRLITLGLAILTNGDLRADTVFNFAVVFAKLFNIWKLLKLTGCSEWWLPFASLTLFLPAGNDTWQTSSQDYIQVLCWCLTAIPLASNTRWAWPGCVILCIVSMFTLAGGFVAWPMSALLLWRRK